MLEIDKVLLLENGEEYLVLDKVEDNNKTYYYIAKLNETKTDIENNYKLVTIKEENNDKILEEVTGVETLKKILPLFESTI